MKEALYYKSLGEAHVQCRLCPHECVIAQNKRGNCGVRVNKDGKLYSEIYGKITSIALDPIEKKPLYHYHPGRRILSIGTKGCNFHCSFCQNWEISQEAEVPAEDMSVGDVIRKAKECGSFGIAYTYNEPFIWYEFVNDTAREARASGLENVFVTNGFINKRPLLEILPYINAMNIDLKAFDEDFYKKICYGELNPVLETIKIASEACHVELTTLLIPDLNDSVEAIEKEVDWIYHHLGPRVPLHFSRYFPCYKMNLPATPVTSIERACAIARKKLNYVYAGNM